MKKTYYKAKSGLYLLRNPEKYIKAVDGYMQSEVQTELGLALKYKSGLERTALLYCDLCSDVTKFGLETFHIPYLGLDGTTHRYFPDLIAEIHGKRFIIEIKSSSDTKYPRRGKNFETRLKKYLTNKLKWDACNRFCESNGLKFKILTEKELT